MKTTLIIAILVGGVAGIGGRLLWKYSPPAPESREPSMAAYWPDQVTANGVVEGARPEVALRPEVTAALTTLQVRENTDVTEGTLLAEVQNDVQKQQVALAEAEVATAKAQLDRVRNGERKEKRRAVAAIAEARRIAYDDAKAAYQRSLRSGSGTSLEALDGAKFKMLRAEADWREAKAEHELIEAPARADEVAQAQARVKAAEAKLELAKADLAKTRLVAPMSGRVLQVFAEPGELAGPTTTQPVLVMADMSRRRVRVFIEELDVSRLQAGQQAVITADGFPGKEFTGKVAVVVQRMGKRAPQSDAPGEYKDVHYREVLIDLDAADELPINLRVQVRIRVEQTVAAQP